MPALPSLDLLSEAVRGERDAQLRHFEALDTKAGILLGFTGVLVAVGRETTGGLALGGLVAAGLAAFLSLAAFVPRDYPIIQATWLRDRYLRADPRFTGLQLLDLRIAAIQRGANLLHRKSRRLTVAAVSLALATVLLLADPLVGWFR